MEIKDIFKTLNYKIGTNKKDILNSDFIGNEIYTIDCLYCHGNKDYGLLLTKSLAEISQIRGDDYLFKWIESKGNIANKNSFLNKQAAYKKCEIVKKYSNDEIRSLVLYISKNYSGVK